MTAHKHLKDAVRARMARTGERYTTAHRHLTGAAAGPAPEGRRPRLPTFGGGRHHDSALLTNGLAAAGIVTAHDGAPFDEPTVAGLAGGIGFMYFSFSYAGELPTMTIVPRIHPRPFLPGALDRAGIAHRVVETTSAAKAARELAAALDAGRAPICTVDRAALAHQVWADRSGAGPYDVAVVGRPERRRADRRRVPGADRDPRRGLCRGACRAPQEPAPDARRRARRRSGRLAPAIRPRSR